MADVYSLASHPQTPFVFASTSRDTTMRFWSLGGSAVQIPMIRSIVNFSWKDSLDKIDNTVLAADVAEMMLYGKESLKLSKLSASEDKILYFKRVFTFFGGATGIAQLWNLVERNIKGHVSEADSERSTHTILHEHDIIQCTESEAKTFESSGLMRIGSGIGGLKRTERLKKAAFLHLQCGNVRRYCMIMIELSEWELALSMAPMVSLSFWQDLAKQYADVLANEESEKAVPFLLASGQANRVIELYKRRNQLSDAFLVIKVHSEGGYDPKVDVGSHKGKTIAEEELDDRVSYIFYVLYEINCNLS